MINVISHFLGLELFNIKLSAKFFQNIPNGLRIKFHFFSEFEPRQYLDQPKCHLTISLATSGQYQCVCKISSQYSTQFKRYGHFHFFRIWSSAKPRPKKKSHFAISWARSCQYQCLRNSLSKYSTQFKR